ncbi:MAG: hypothetical protein WCL32_20090 [Planctomycetota bacterium]
MAFALSFDRDHVIEESSDASDGEVLRESPVSEPLRLFIDWLPNWEARRLAFQIVIQSFFEKRRRFDIPHEAKPRFLFGLRDPVHTADRAEVLWYRCYLLRTISLPPPSAGQMEAVVLADVISRSPELVESSDTDADSFHAFARSRLSPTVWEHVAKQMIGVFSDSATIEKAIEKWFSPLSPWHRLLTAMEGRNYLRQVGPAIVQRIVANSADVCAHLSQLLEHATPAIIEEAAQQAVVNELTKIVAQIRGEPQRMHRAVAADSDRANKVLRLCRPLAAVADKVDYDVLRLNWMSICECLVDLQPTQFRQSFPIVFNLGQGIAHLFPEPDAVWVSLFRPVALSRTARQLAHFFVAAADSVFVEGADPSALGELAALRGHPDLSDFFWSDSPPAKANTSWLGIRKSPPPPQAVDEIASVLGKLPEDGSAPTASRDRILRRARLAAALYPDDMRGLAGIYWNLGTPATANAPANWQPRRVAFAILGYLTADGRESEQIADRADRLFTPGFLTPFAQRCQKNGSAVCKAFDECKREIEFDDSAARVSTRLRKAL